MNFFTGQAYWITPADKEIIYAKAGRMILFRRKFHGKGKLIAAICADSEYRLFCNGIEVAQGPAAGTTQIAFYDTVELTPYLHDGENELIAEVVGFAHSFPDFYRGGAPMGKCVLTDAFIMDALLIRKDGSEEFIGSNELWQCAASPAVTFCRCPGVPCAGPGEIHNGRSIDEADFSPAVPVECGLKESNVKNSMLSYRLAPKMIAPLKRQMRKFTSFFDQKGTAPEKILEMLSGKNLQIPPDTEVEFSLDVQEETTGRIITDFFSGSAKITINYAENLTCNEKRIFSPELPHDEINAPMYDSVSSSSGRWRWKSFFYRAFRFVKIKVHSGIDGCSLNISQIEEEFYNFPNKADFTSGKSEEVRLWQIGKRTLELCSHQIFEDCPYYERVQYSADARIAARIAMMVSGDTALAEQSLIHFRHSLRANGLTAGSYPSRSPVTLPQWSLHYALMCYELYLFTGKISIAKENIKTIRSILEFFFEHHLPEGGIGKMPYWNMGDFSTGWNWLGEPPESDKKSSAYTTFLVLETITKYKDLALAAQSRFDIMLAEEMENSLIADCSIFFDADKQIYSDTPGGNSFSLLTNAQAVSARITDDRQLIARCMNTPGIIEPALFGKNFLFDALIKCGDRKNAEKILDTWKEMLNDGRTVWPEGTPHPRSECHVWSSLPTTALPLLYTGFRILSPGGRKVAFAPISGRCSGKIPLIHGEIIYHLDDTFMTVDLPEGIELLLPDGSLETGIKRFKIAVEKC